MADRPLPAHSVAEVYLYLMANACESCGLGPLRGAPARRIGAGGHPGEGPSATASLVVAVTCGSCGAERLLRFEVPVAELEVARQAPPDAAARINPTREPSRIIDVGAWVMLFRVITEAAAKTADKIESRKLAYEAAQCLEEALKFYEDDNDLPPEVAFFSEESRRRHREHPQRLARSRLIDLRAKLPTLDAMEKQLARTRGRKAGKGGWWRRGR